MRLTAIRARAALGMEAGRARREKCQEASGRCRGTQVVGPAAQVVGERRADGRMATEAARLKPKKLLIKKTVLTLTGRLMEGLEIAM
jgi:hypothetical protein